MQRIYFVAFFLSLSHVRKRRHLLSFFYFFSSFSFLLLLGRGGVLLVPLPRLVARLAPAIELGVQERVDMLLRRHISLVLGDKTTTHRALGLHGPFFLHVRWGAIQPIRGGSDVLCISCVRIECAIRVCAFGAEQKIVCEYIVKYIFCQY